MYIHVVDTPEWRWRIHIIIKVGTFSLVFGFCWEDWTAKIVHLVSRKQSHLVRKIAPDTFRKEIEERKKTEFSGKKKKYRKILKIVVYFLIWMNFRAKTCLGYLHAHYAPYVASGQQIQFCLCCGWDARFTGSLTLRRTLRRIDVELPVDLYLNEFDGRRNVFHIDIIIF